MPSTDPRARRAGLSREQVLDAALALLDAKGVKAFTLRALASELGVDPMAIYWHVKGKDEILDGVVGLAMKRVQAPSTGPWWRRVEELARAHRALMHTHPAVLDLVLSRPVLSTDSWTGTERFLTLAEPKLGADSAARWLRLIASFVNGYLLTERREIGYLHLAAQQPDLPDRPRTEEVLSKLAERSEADFEAGLTLLISGMRAEAEQNR